MINKFRNFFLLVILLSFQLNKLHSQKLSERAEISLITCNPGEDLYSVFGHNAIRVKDLRQNIDWVYNYGTFSFEEPNFYVKFVRGQLNYQLAVNHMKHFMYSYRKENRSVYEQVLNLTQNQKQNIFNFLENNRKPENKFYLYDFFFDNCATRIRDVMENNLNKDLTFANDYKDSLTFRDMLKPYLKNHPWSRFGIRLILGAITDRQANLSETMVLPDYVMNAFSKAKVNIAGNEEDFVKHSAILFKESEKDDKYCKLTMPIVVFWFVFAIAVLLLVFEYKKNTYYKVFDFIYLLFIGIIGLILFLVWFATDHTAVVKNWNLLWALPTHFFIAFLLLRKKQFAFLNYYFLITGAIAFLVLPFWFFIPQSLSVVFIPMILTISLRSFYYYYYHKIMN